MKCASYVYYVISCDEHGPSVEFGPFRKILEAIVFCRSLEEHSSHSFGLVRVLDSKNSKHD